MIFIIFEFWLCRQEMRKIRLSSSQSVTHVVEMKTAEGSSEPVNVRDFQYLRVGASGKLFKLNWNAAEKKKKSGNQKGMKLFTVSVVEKLIQVSQVV